MFASLVQGRRAFTPFRRLVLLAAMLVVGSSLSNAQAAPYSQVIVFGDSLSDDGNVTHRTNDAFGINYPGGTFNYSDGRFTNSSDTNPGSNNYIGVWHEQFARRFLKLPRASNSLDGGTNYAFGGATTQDGTQKRTVVSNPTPFGGGQYTITIDNMGRQVTTYLAKGAADGNALFIVWGGGNDLFDDASAANVTATANRVGALVNKLALAGARTFLVPNVPPLGDIPHYNTDANQKAALNAASSSYRDQLNSVLDSTIANLNAQGITVTVARLDVYSIFLDLVANKTAYGFINVADSGQGKDVKADSYLFWDDIHPTTAGHSQIAQAAANIVPGGHPAFFNGEALLGSDFAYLGFPSGTQFGYYSYQFFPYLYSSDLGFEYFLDAGDADSGAYLYDFTLKTFLYTSPALYPYLYNFNAGAFYYYFTGTTNPRVFVNLTTGEYIYN